MRKRKPIAIEEIAVGKGHHYLTVVLDLLSGAVVFVGDGEGAEALSPFWQRLRASRAKIQAVATDFADTLEEHEKGILAYYDNPISTGPLEGTNTKIQAMKRQADGFRDRAFYKLKLLGIHESQYALAG